MKILGRIAGIVVLVGSLVLIRQTEYDLFYDPFMAFFQGGQEALEQMPLQWYLNLFFRFLLNTVISLGILYLCFLKWSVVKFSALLYGVLFLVLFPVFIYLMGKVTPGDYLAVFYVRRFLVHPVLLLLLIPAFIYQRLKGGAVKLNGDGDDLSR